MPPPEVKVAARALQDSFAELDWIAPLPEHFLHVSAHGSWAQVAPFPIVYRRANCFHDAVIVEAHAREVAPPPPSLPHLSLGYFRSAEPPDRLRDGLIHFRDIELGIGIVEEVLICDVPIGKTTVLEPWTVVETIRLGERAL